MFTNTHTRSSFKKNISVWKMGELKNGHSFITAYPAVIKIKLKKTYN